MKKLKYLSQSGFWPSGNPRIYFRPKGCLPVPMPDAEKSSPEFIEAYSAAYELLASGGMNGEPPPRFSAAVRKQLQVSRKRSAERAKARGIPHTLSDDDLTHMLLAQNGRCAATGVAFDVTPSKSSWRKPNAPSLDRLDITKGYVQDNVRIVTTIFNLARNDFSDDEIVAMSRALLRNRMATYDPTSDPTMEHHP